MSRFEDELAAAAEAAPLDEALAGLHRIAVAAGVLEETWQARSVGEVCDMIAAWCRWRRTPPGQGGWRVVMVLAEPGRESAESTAARLRAEYLPDPAIQVRVLPPEDRPGG